MSGLYRSLLGLGLVVVMVIAGIILSAAGVAPFHRPRTLTRAEIAITLGGGTVRARALPGSAPVRVLVGRSAPGAPAACGYRPGPSGTAGFTASPPVTVTGGGGPYRWAWSARVFALRRAPVLPGQGASTEYLLCALGSARGQSGHVLDRVGVAAAITGPPLALAGSDWATGDSHGTASSTVDLSRAGRGATVTARERIASEGSLVGTLAPDSDLPADVRGFRGDSVLGAWEGGSPGPGGNVVMALWQLPAAAPPPEFRVALLARHHCGHLLGMGCG